MFESSIERGGGAGVHSQLAQHPRHMMVDRALANPQEDGDFQIPLALPQPPVNFPLAQRERGEGAFSFPLKC